MPPLDVTHTASQAGSRTAQHRERQQLTLETMRHLGLPEHQQQLVGSYFDYVWYRHNNFDGLIFLERLPETLRARICAKVRSRRRPSARTHAFARAPSHATTRPRLCTPASAPAPTPAPTSAPTPARLALTSILRHKVHGDMVRRVAAFEGAPADVVALLCMQVLLPLPSGGSAPSYRCSCPSRPPSLACCSCGRRSSCRPTRSAASARARARCSLSQRGPSQSTAPRGRCCACCARAISSASSAW